MAKAKKPLVSLTALLTILFIVSFAAGLLYFFDWVSRPSVVQFLLEKDFRAPGYLVGLRDKDLPNVIHCYERVLSRTNSQPATLFLANHVEYLHLTLPGRTIANPDEASTKLVALKNKLSRAYALIGQRQKAAGVDVAGDEDNLKEVQTLIESSAKNGWKK